MVLVGKKFELARYHRLMAYKESNPEVAAVHARTSASISTNLEGEERNTEKMLCRLCTQVPVADGDISELRQLLEKSGNWGQIGRASCRERV